MKTRFVLNFVLLAAFSSGALANETYKFDQSRSAIGFTVHQFLGTSHGKFAKFDGKIDIDREHPEKSSVVAKIDVRSIDTGIVKPTTICAVRNFLTSQSFPKSHLRAAG
jgi:polyisoprenoid-binding protein YceI